MTQATSFKQLIKDCVIRRADAMRIPYDRISVEPGFNLREEGEDFEASIVELAEYIAEGGQIPALEVRPVDGGVVIVDGHRRHRAIGLLIERGLPIELVDVVAFRGNDVDRVARIMTSAEGRSLSPLETARGYKRLEAYGLSPADIAKKVGKTRQHVEQLLLLAHANNDVHAMVRAGTVSAAIAIDAARKHGEKAGEFLAAQYDKAAAAGQSKVTSATIKGKSFSRAVVTNVVESVDKLFESLPSDAKMKIAELEGKAGFSVDEVITLPASLVMDLMSAHVGIITERHRHAEKARIKAEKAAQIELKDAA